MNAEYDKIGIAMYTVHNSVEQDMYRTFCQLSRMGYGAVEFYGEPDYNIEIIRKSIIESGMTLSGWHIEWKNLKEDRFNRTVDYLQKAGCPLAVIPCLGGKWKVNHGPEEECLDIWLSYIEEINRISEKLKKEGIRTAYHNHEHEFMLDYQGKKVFDILFEGFCKEIIMEFDSGNCIEAGVDPAKVLSGYRDREIILHMKPYSHRLGFDTVLGEAEDANDWGKLLDQEKHRYLLKLIESENELLPEMTNAQLCISAYHKLINTKQ